MLTTSSPRLYPRSSTHSYKDAESTLLKKEARHAQTVREEKEQRELEQQKEAKAQQETNEKEVKVEGQGAKG